MSSLYEMLKAARASAVPAGEAEDGVARNMITDHKANRSNPHKVTKAQVGLSNVDNTADIDKPVSAAVQSALNSAIAAESDAREAADEETTAALAELVDSGAKNLYSLSGKSTTTNNGITFAVDGTEGSITMTGTASNGDAVFTLLTSMDIGEGFVMSGWGSVDGAKDGWFMDSYSTGYTDRKIFYTSAKTVSDTFVWRLIVKNGATMDGVVFKPMLCTKAAWGISQKHVPYRPSYQELYDRILALENQQ